MALAEEQYWPRDRVDADYTARNCVTGAEFARIIAAYRSLSAPARDLSGTRPGLAYDSESAETLDLYGTAGDGALRPCFMFIHGGYWRALSKADSAFMAPMLAARGIVTAVPDYTLAPAASLTEIVRQMRAALAFLWRNAPDLGIDRGRIVVGGSSAGGHLTGTLMSPGWQAAAGIAPAPLAGALPVSGLFDLGAIAASHVQDWMALTEAEIEELSPLRRLPAHPVPGPVAVAEIETPGFHRQSAAFGAAVGAPVLTIAGRNHFDVILDLTDPQSVLARALLDLF